MTVNPNIIAHLVKAEAPDRGVLDCPVCCARPIFEWQASENTWRIRCEECEQFGMLVSTKFFATPEEATTVWNGENLSEISIKIPE
ncbi:hypothetical protein [Bradyrhizobium sp. DASA03120]|uniref:hypothetical protein n=1 Tax=Bradyrhizobium sp. SMVTL-02 TaxID=3395917 RepID=UPI003F6E5A49